MTAASLPPAHLGASFVRHTGTVSSFDDHAGRGMVTSASGDSWYFHCTRIADGSRSIALETTVTFEVAPGPTGLEASDVRPVPA